MVGDVSGVSLQLPHTIGACHWPPARLTCRPATFGGSSVGRSTSPVTSAGSIPPQTTSKPAATTGRMRWTPPHNCGCLSPATGCRPRSQLLTAPSDRVDDKVRDFYDHTASWGLDVWSQWNTLFASGGEVIAPIWGRRVEQPALPVTSMSVSHRMASAVRVVDDENGERAGLGCAP